VRARTAIIGVHQLHGLYQWICEKNVRPTAVIPALSRRVQSRDAGIRASASGGHR
jgi:hypothetical protein